MVKTTRVGLIMNVLSMMNNVVKKSNFIIAMLRGFAANFPLEKQIELADHIFQVVEERPPFDLK